MNEKVKTVGEYFACSICGGNSEVTNTRPGVNGWQRRRRCKNCGYSWSTLEVNTSQARRPSRGRPYILQSKGMEH